VLPYPIVEHLVSDLHRKPSALLSPIECGLPSVLFHYPLLFFATIPHREKRRVFGAEGITRLSLDTSLAAKDAHP
jgi:hypothetical protein